MKIMIGLPAYSGFDPRTTSSLMLLAAALTAKSIPWSHTVVMGDADFSHAINTLLQSFIESDADRIFICDSDIIFNTQDALKVICSEHDWIGGNAARRAFGRGLASTPKVGGAVMGELVEANVLGTGFLALSRNVVERLVQAYPHTVYTQRDGGMAFGLLENSLQNGEWLSGDATVCRRWQAIGGTCWIDTSINLGHVGTHVFTEQDA